MNGMMHRLTTQPNVAGDASARVVADPAILGGTPVVGGNRVPAATLVDSLRHGCSDQDIMDDYPTLPAGWRGAIEAWADVTFGPKWRRPTPAGR